MKSKKKWIKFRHKVTRAVLGVTFAPYCKLKYRIKIEKFKNREKRQFLILFNHQTAYDQFFVGMAFKCPIYYMASEDIFSNGILSSLIKYLAEPIPIRKQSADVHAVINCMKVAAEGGTIALAPEGNRTYSGKTCYINPSIAPLAKKLSLPIAIFKIEGGYGTHPRWSDTVRRGKKMRGYVSRVIEPGEYENLSNDELYSVISKELYQNEAEWGGEYHHKNLAEGLERAIYVCPECKLSRFKTKGDLIQCEKCGNTARYLPNKEFSGVGFDFPFKNVLEWYEYQETYINSLDTEKLCESPIYEDFIRLSETIPYKPRKLIRKRAKISLYGDRITLCENESDSQVFAFDEISGLAVLGKNKLNIYKNKKETYQLKGDKSFCALKYLNIYHRHKNLTRGDKNGKFLGL